MIGGTKDIYLSPTGFVLQNLPWGVYQKCAQSTKQNTIQKMSTTKPPAKKGMHGGARSVLCWQEKMALMEENVIQEFLSKMHCGCTCNCGDRIRDLGRTAAVKVIQGLRTERLAGTIPIICSQTRQISMMLATTQHSCR